MLFPAPLQPAVLIRRYQRFLAEVRLADGSTTTVHCPNTGSMRGCSAPGIPVRLSTAANPQRKYPQTLEMVKVGTTWVGVNTARTNGLVREAIIGGIFPELGEIVTIQPEVKVGASRLDFRLDGNGITTWLEVKNCSLAEAGTALFPDAVTTRGTRHLHELATLRRKGFRAAIIFCVQRGDTESFAPAAAIDPLYAATLAAVAAEGVLVLAGRATVTPTGITIDQRLPVYL